MGFVARVAGRVQKRVDWLGEPLKATTKEGLDKGRTGDPNDFVLSKGLQLVLGLFGLFSFGAWLVIVGSGVTWERFDQAGLPATQALDVVPESQLLKEGAKALFVAVVIGLFAVVAVFAFNPNAVITRGSFVVLGLLWLGAVLYAWLGTPVGFVTVVILAVVAGLLALASLGVGGVTGDYFGPFAAALFFATVIYAGVLNFAVAANEDLVQPVAALKEKSGHGLHGFYVADTEDFIYLGLIREDYVGNRMGDDDAPPIPLYRLPREDETRFLLGPPQPWNTAKATSCTYLNELLAMPRAAKTGDGTGGGQPVC